MLRSTRAQQLSRALCEVYRWAARQDDLGGSTEVRRAALAGDSSGGAIALLAAVDLVSAGESPSALLLAYPNADMTLSGRSVEEKSRGWGLDRRDLTWFVQQWVPEAGRRKDGRVSPLHADLAGLPPAVLATVEHDPLRDEGRALVERMRAAGVAVDHVHEGGLVHGFLGLGSISRAAEIAGEELYERFARLLDQQEEGPGTHPRSGDELDRYLDSVLIGGRERVTPVISDYDPAWPARFAELEARIRPALGDVALVVEHIGSTSVPGLAAKPIIDVLVVVADVDEEGSYVTADGGRRLRPAGARGWSSHVPHAGQGCPRPRVLSRRSGHCRLPGPEGLAPGRRGRPRPLHRREARPGEETVVRHEPLRGGQDGCDPGSPRQGAGLASVVTRA